MPNARIIGTGACVPPRVVTNDDLVREYGIDTSDEWIQRRTGVVERRFADAGVGASDLGIEAGRAALASADVDPGSVDLVIGCTLSPDKAFPGIAVTIQRGLGMAEEGGRFPAAMDIRAQCSGFLYGLSHATAMIRAGMAERVLLVGAEVHSAALDLTTRGRTVASLFGDGAAAVVLEASEDPGVRCIHLGADGRYADDLSQGVWDMRQRPFVRLDDDGNGVIPPDQLYAVMNGQLVFKHAVVRMTAALTEVCEDEGVALADVDLFLFHQANKRINQLVQAHLEIPDHKVAHNIERYGNTTAATIPLLLDEAVRSGRLERGMTVAMTAFGSGFTWGAALATY